MQLKIHSFNNVRAHKEHVCKQCQGSIPMHSQYWTIALRKKINGEDKFENRKVHPVCMDLYVKEHFWHEDSTTSIAMSPVEQLMAAMETFHKRWDTANTTKLSDRVSLLNEETKENEDTNEIKVTHFEKVVRLLTTERNDWIVLEGPTHVHPEVAEVMNNEDWNNLKGVK